jgi:glycosyltransferase involved in cell wall biosynthesis
MIKITAITSGRNVPSSRFRVRQFITPLAELGIAVTELYARPDKYSTRRIWPVGLVTRLPALLASRQSDITWLEREMIAGRVTFERFAGGTRLLDIDDAIWLNAKSNTSARLTAECAGVIAGNDFIADHYRRHAQKVWVVPTSVDTERWQPREQSQGNGRPHWNIGWIGTSSNLPYLYGYEEAMADFLAERGDAHLTIVADSAPSFKKLSRQSWRFRRWSEHEEIKLAQDFDVGLMPLPDTDWARGKCALKMLQYMALGIPVVASPVGTARSIFAQSTVGVAAVSPQDWYDGLKLLYDDRQMAARMGASGRELVEQSYSVEKNVHRLAEIFRSLNGRGV